MTHERSVCLERVYQMSSQSDKSFEVFHVDGYELGACHVFIFHCPMNVFKFVKIIETFGVKNPRLESVF